MKTNYSKSFEDEGRIWFRDVISKVDLGHFDEIARLKSKAGKRIEHNGMLSSVLSESGSLLQIIAKLDPKAKPVRVVSFNKTTTTNWGVPWHQDRVIAVADQHQVDGYQNWTNKSGVWHCEPPQEILDQMLFVRIHLDETDASNGAMQIAVGSHLNGIIPASNAEKTAEEHPVEDCNASRGDVLILKMLTLHCSKPSITQNQRRALRIDFAPFDLPSPLKWA